MRAVVGLIGWVLVAFAAGAVGALATRDARDYYAMLELPNWAPPGWVFGPVWMLLYLLMGLGAWLVWRARGFGGAPAALSLFGVQLVLNALWSWVFFAWRLPGWAAVEVVILLAFVVATTIAFWRVRPAAGALLVPYLAWVSFATMLNLAIWRLNV